MKRVLIIGGGGFIGSHLARAYLDKGSAVTIVARQRTALHRLTDIADRLRIFRIDLTDDNAVAEVFNEVGPDAVFHLANKIRSSTSNGGLSDINFMMSRNLRPLLTVLSGASNCDAPPKVFVRTGSIAEYGTITPPFTEGCREGPADPYGVSLLAGTHCLRVAQAHLPFRAISARLALTYGPDQEGDFLVPSLVDALVAGQPVELRRPYDRRDLIHVDDAVSGLMALAEHASRAPLLANISTGISTRTAEVAQMIAKFSGADPQLISTGAPDNPPVELCSDPSLLKTRIGWQHQIGVAAGLQRTVAWRQKTQGA